MNLAKRKHLDETPVRRGMTDTTLRLKQDKEGIRMIKFGQHSDCKWKELNMNFTR